LKFFLDPKKVIEEYKRCPLHKSRSKLESNELGCVWKYIYGQNLNGAHDALEDAKAQTDIVSSKYFVDYINCRKSIRFIEDIFSRADQRDMAKELDCRFAWL
jgi:hypothetical protein